MKHGFFKFLCLLIGMGAMSSFLFGEKKSDVSLCVTGYC